MKSTILLISFSIVLGVSHAQTYKLKQRLYGSGGQAQLYDMKITADNGFIMCGYASGSGYDKTDPGYGGYDMWVVKAGPLGKVKWNVTLGGASADIGYSITPAPGNKGYLVVGTSSSGVSGNKTSPAYGGLDVWVVKLDNNGNIEWQKTYGGTGDDGYYTWVDTTLDGGYVLGTSSRSGVSGTKTSPLYGDFYFDNWVMKLDANGNVIWDKDYGGTKDEFFAQVKHTKDGGFIIGSNSDSEISGSKTEANRGTRANEEGAKQDYWLVKVDKDGNQLWDKTLGTTSPDDNLYSIAETADGGYIANGAVEAGVSADKTSPVIGAADYWLVKVDKNGNKLWDRTVGGTSGEDLGYLEPTKDSGFVIAGTSSSNISGNKTENSRGYGDYWLVKLDKNGYVQWDKTIGGDNFDECWAVCVADNNRYLLGGLSWSGISGDKNSATKGFGDYWIVGVEHSNNTTIAGNLTTGKLVDDALKVSVYPNPAAGVININTQKPTTVTLVNASGKTELTRVISGATQINVSRFANGVYYIKTNLQKEPVKVVIQH